MQHRRRVRNFALVLLALTLGVLWGATELMAQDYCRTHGAACSSCSVGKSSRVYSADPDYSENYCSKFSACSINRDLSGATGPELTRYLEEKSLDGQSFSDWEAPDFSLGNTLGETVRLSDYRGKRVALFFLAGHCRHSLETIPIITKLKSEYEPRGIAILPVYVNSGSVEDVEYFRSAMKLPYPLIVSPSKDIAYSYNSLIVPSVFLIDEEGRITRRFVGYKSSSVLHLALNDLAEKGV